MQHSPDPTIDQVVSALQTVIPGTNGFQGDVDTYDDPANADLFSVLDRKRGLPVALALLYIHAARRCGITITGIDFPGHFLLRLQVNGKRRIIDPFHGGITLRPTELRELLKSFCGPDAELEPRHYRESSDADILLRLQNNIKVRALRAGKLDHAAHIIGNSLLLCPDHEGLWHQLGALYARLDQDEMALGAFEQFTRLCQDPVHRTRIEAVVGELRNRLGMDGPDPNDADQNQTVALPSNPPIPLYPDMPSESNGTTGPDSSSSGER